MKIQSILVGSAILLSSISFSTHADHHADSSMMKPDTVVDIAMSSDIHTTLVTAVVEADLASTLSSEGPFTVFAPTNAAFSKLPAGKVDMLLQPENIDMLRSILTYHIIP